MIDAVPVNAQARNGRQGQKDQHNPNPPADYLAVRVVHHLPAVLIVLVVTAPSEGFGIRLHDLAPQLLFFVFPARRTGVVHLIIS